MGIRCFQLSIAIVVFSCFSSVATPTNTNEAIIHELNAALTDVMIVDGFSPPQASRVYYYSHVAYYEVIRQLDSEYLTLSGQLNGLTIPLKTEEQVNFELAATLVFKEIGSSMVYRSEVFRTAVDKICDGHGYELGTEKSKKTEKYATKVAKQFLKWISEDGYVKLKSMPRYQLKRTVDSWEPTPPAYTDALEPNWHQLRSASMESVTMFNPKLEVAFDTVPASSFYQQALTVYETSQNLNDEQRMIAKFWDCNPMQTKAEGHFMFNLKQMTPGGHWMAITGIVCSDKGLSNIECSSIYTHVAIGLFDGFLSAWSVKYKYHLIRPVTYINRYIDKNWMPLLETPPFPEFTSAHSVISRCSAEILNTRVGEVAFVDTVETRWGYPVRKFNSLIEAGVEVSTSRVLGGIHFPFGVEKGMSQGELLGKHLLSSIRFKE